MNKKTRIKKELNPPSIATRADAEVYMNDIALAENTRRELIARRDAEVLAVNERFAFILADWDKLIKERTEQLQNWAQDHPEEFPKGRKSIDMAAGVLGFRTGTPKLKLLGRSWTWDKVLAAVQHTLPAFVRSKPEVDKEAILNQRDELAYALPMVGLRVDQDESFYIEPKLTDTEAKQTLPA
jgi:phage host-nuclease inhibitor protein Gam